MQPPNEGRLTEEAFRQKLREGKMGRPLIGGQKAGDVLKRRPLPPQTPRPR